MTIGLTTRPAATSEAPVLVALINSAYRGDSSKAGWTTEADLLGGQRVDVEGLTDTIARPGNVILLHERDQVPVACVRASVVRCSRPPNAGNGTLVFANNAYDDDRAAHRAHRLVRTPRLSSDGGTQTFSVRR
jgi:hypothetical protein